MYVQIKLVLQKLQWAGSDGEVCDESNTVRDVSAEDSKNNQALTLCGTPGACRCSKELDLD